MTRLDVPLYVRIADDLRTQIEAGELPPGARLPTEQQLIRRYGVARETVRKGFELLRNDALITTRSGKGRFVPDKLPMERVELEQGDEVVGRMPTSAERAELGVRYGVPIIEVRRADGTARLYPSDRTMLAAGKLSEDAER